MDEIPEEYLAFRTEEAGKAAREALRIRFSNFDEEDLNQNYASGCTKYKKTDSTTKTKHFSKEDGKGLNLPISQKSLYVFD